MVMAEDNELEKRAVEELLRETDRARVRAETMGPAGWLKCPLQGTNKRFLLNTLRSTDLQRRSDGSRGRRSDDTRGRTRSESPDRRRARSRSPQADPRNDGSRTERKRSPPLHRDKRLDRDKDEQRRHRQDRRKIHKDGQKRDKDRRIQTS
ncbi:PREDICTED: DNA-directed RNA polymerases I and III subunit RPAC2 isoform X1 [Cyprinodon variegatus]|uniref:Si:ch211-140b10.6 n=1 Tax=Cyprinodon variegatus TaxID=28743 RepID=A0A3Q2DYK7_CYPVA|nr:PREDICTED: DNA-directed RNA polymerases I and III subunit RPAC2 isoform X1 [Cyprinodon variegatus]